MEELRENIKIKIEKLENDKKHTTVPSQLEIAISNLYIALVNTYRE